MSKTQKDNKEKPSSKLTRRSMLKMGAAAGAVTILSPTILTSRKSTVYAQGTVAEPVLCAPTPVPQRPPHTLFVDDLPVPAPAIPQFLSPAPTENANIAG